ncbi:hypothetical protein TNCV_3972871 [Trichonephila clavipes]|nr:hypothetical protein TNCV_3972871 [Trichonephila clavipes]
MSTHRLTCCTSVGKSVIRNCADICDGRLHMPKTQTCITCTVISFFSGYIVNIVKQRVQALKPADNPLRLNFCQSAVQQHALQPNFTTHVLFTDMRGNVYTTTIPICEQPRILMHINNDSVRMCGCYQIFCKMFRSPFLTTCGFSVRHPHVASHFSTNVCALWGAINWAWWISPLANPISRIIEARLLFMGHLKNLVYARKNDFCRRRYNFDQSRRVLLSSDLHSISILMAQMETDPPDITNSCEERNRLSLEIEALDIVINRCTELVKFPGTDDNHKMKAILRASIDDTKRKEDTMVRFCGRLCLPKKTARPVSHLPSEPVTVNKSFSDLESKNDKDQVAPEKNNETAPPKSKPPPPIHL